MNFFKVLSISCLVLGLAGCLPGEQKIFKEQDLKTSSARADQVAVALADAIQNEVSAYFEAQIVTEDDALNAPLLTNDSGVVRSKQCENGVFAYIATGQKIRGLGSLEKGSGMQMMRSLQKRFGSKNVGYQTPKDQVSGLDKMRTADLACFEEIETADIALGSPIVALSFAQISEAAGLDGGAKELRKVYACSTLSADLPVGNIVKSCQVELEVNQEKTDIVSVTTTCDDEENYPTVDEISAQCQSQAQSAAQVSVTETVAMGTDWSAFFQNPGAAPLTVKCVEGGDCQPFEEDTNSSVVVECSDDNVAPKTVLNPIIQNGVPISERDSNGAVINRDCGHGWTGRMIAEYQTRQCVIYDVEKDADGNEISRTERAADSEKATIYKIYYVAADCEKVVENVVTSCPVGQGNMYVNQAIKMSKPLAFHPEGVNRGEKSEGKAKIAIKSDFDADDSLPRDLKDRMSAEFLISDVDLNGVTDENNFTELIREAYGQDMAFEDVACHAIDGSCYTSSLPGITVALVDRSGSMRDPTERKISTTKFENTCKMGMHQAFKNPDRSCAMLDNFYAARDYCIEEREECRYDPSIYCDLELDPFCDQTECEWVFEDCFYDRNSDPFITEQIFQDLLDDNQALMEVAGVILSYITPSYDDDANLVFEDTEVIDCNTSDIFSDFVSALTSGGSANMCSQDFNAPPCQEGCPGQCVTEAVTIPSVDKIRAVDDTLRHIITPRLQYGSSFLYGYFINNTFESVESTIPKCKLLDDPNTTEDDNQPLCTDYITLTDYHRDIRDKIETVAQKGAGGGTPLYQSIEQILPQIDALVAEHQALGLPTDIAFYLMTDGDDTIGGGIHDSVCDAITNPNAFSADFKNRYPGSKIYILDLPGVSNNCQNFALQTNESIDQSAPAADPGTTINPGSTPNMTVDAFFYFTDDESLFTRFFGESDILLPLDGKEMCEKMGLGDVILEGEFDGEIGVGGEDAGPGIRGDASECPIITWDPVCLGFDGEVYPKGHTNCGPSCIGYDGKLYPESSNNCVPGCTDSIDTSIRRKKVKVGTTWNFPYNCRGTCDIDGIKHYKYRNTSPDRGLSLQCSSPAEQCQILQDGAVQWASSDPTCDNLYCLTTYEVNALRSQCVSYQDEYPHCDDYCNYNL